MAPRRELRILCRAAFNVVYLFLAVLALQSCATLTKEECLAADWRVIGERDGAAGQPLSFFARHVDACKKTTSVPNQTLWREGHKAGARRYCTAENGLRVGNAGKTYNNICEPDQQVDFLPAYELGRERHGLLSARERKVREFRSVNNQIAEARKNLAKGKLSEEQALTEIGGLRRQRRFLIQDIDQLDADIARFDTRLIARGYQAPAKPARVY